MARYVAGYTLIAPNRYLAIQPPTPHSYLPLPTGRPPIQDRSEKRCGDGVCDGPENPQNCPVDCVM